MGVTGWLVEMIVFSFKTVNYGFWIGSFADRGGLDAQAVLHCPRYYFNSAQRQNFLNVKMLNLKLLERSRIPVYRVSLGFFALIF